MIEHVNEYDFYMQYEDYFFSEAPAGVLAFVTPGSNECEVIVNKLETISEAVDIPILILDIDDIEYLAGELDITGAPAILVYKNGIIDRRFEDDFDVGYMADYIMEIQTNLE